MNLVNAALGVMMLALVVALGYKAGQLVIELNKPTIPQVSPASFVLTNESYENTAFARWNHFPLTVKINAESLGEDDRNYFEDFRNAMIIWETSTNGLMSFREVEGDSADITVEWVKTLKEKSTDNIGDTELSYVNVSYGGVIKNAAIELLSKSGPRKLNDNDMTNLALHELGHAIGLQHTDDKTNIMYPVLVVPSDGIIRISDGERRLLEEVYSIEPKPDLKIVEVNVTKAVMKRFVYTYYLLNVSMIIGNDGLLESPALLLHINANNMTVKNDTMPDVGIGTKLSIVYGNLQVDGDFEQVDIVVDPYNAIDEMNEANNKAMLRPA
ncbi:MAG: matrixin family metalloprotease [Candidatus Aenigmarchaeota archaeon]|nr:matrixin family metalloprotease [Candidatus Aenigmarchaeota archaeon]